MTTIAETPGGDGDPTKATHADALMRQGAKRNPRAWIALTFFAALALFMYVSIMLKIMKYGP